MDTEEPFRLGTLPEETKERMIDDHSKENTDLKGKYIYPIHCTDLTKVLEDISTEPRLRQKSQNKGKSNFRIDAHFEDESN